MGNDVEVYVVLMMVCVIEKVCGINTKLCVVLILVCGKFKKLCGHQKGIDVKIYVRYLVNEVDFIDRNTNVCAIPPHLDRHNQQLVLSLRPVVRRMLQYPRPGSRAQLELLSD